MSLPKELSPTPAVLSLLLHALTAPCLPYFVASISWEFLLLYLTSPPDFELRKGKTITCPSLYASHLLAHSRCSIDIY